MKVLIYSHYFWPAIGGVETYARLIAEGMARDAGIDATVVTQTTCRSAEPAWSFQLLRRPGAWKLWAAIRSSDVVLIAGPSILPMLLSILGRRPFVIEHHGYQAICPNGLLLNKVSGGVCAEAFRRGVYSECRSCLRKDQGPLRADIQLVLTMCRRWLSRRAYSNIAVSAHVKRRHDLERMEVIYHGILEAKTAEQVVEPDDNEHVHFGYVGRLVEEKGLHLLIEAAGKLSSRGIRYRLSIIGDGPLRRILEGAAEEDCPGAQIEFTGFLEGPAMSEIVSRVDVIVMPSVWEETAGLAAMEQMMRGKVVLVADIGGLGEVVGDGGVKFEPFNAEDLAGRMIELTSIERRRHVGMAARARAVKMFRLDRMIEEHKVLFRQAVAANSLHH